MLSNSEKCWSDIELPLPRGLNLKCIGPIEEDLCCDGQTVYVGTLKQRQPLRTNTYIILPQTVGSGCWLRRGLVGYWWWLSYCLFLFTWYFRTLNPRSLKMTLVKEER